jgi:hypothetical protein
MQARTDVTAITRAMNVILVWLRSWIFVLLYWINNADQTLGPFQMARVKTQSSTARVGRRLLSKLYAISNSK